MRKKTVPAKSALGALAADLRKMCDRARSHAKRLGFRKGCTVVRICDGAVGSVHGFNMLTGGVACASRKPLLVDYAGILCHHSLDEVRLCVAASGSPAVFSFTVPGIPVPYLRMTQDQVQLMRIPDARLDKGRIALKSSMRRYLKYKDLCRERASGLAFNRYPLAKVYLNVMVYFDRANHADPENIRKGLQDAIYDNDRMVAGLVDFAYDFNNPRCEVTIVEPNGASADLMALLSGAFPVDSQDSPSA